MRTYISLFSSAGVGCYGFKENGFECIATSELIKSRIDIQKFNKKCKYQSGYICGDITDNSIQNKIYEEINYWKNNENLIDVDVVVVDPPRGGLDKITIDKLLNGNCRKIVYVSCNPITLARDIKLLNDKYDFKDMTLFDMFPNTKHVECVSLLYRKKT